MGDTNVPAKPIWDGQSSTMTRTTATVAMLAQQNRRNYEELQKQKAGINSLNNGDDKDGRGNQLIQGSNELAKLEEGVHLE